MTVSSVKRVLALGTFDGLHPGHRAVISKCVDLAKDLCLRSMVYTFWENPRSLFGSKPIDIMSPERRLSEILLLGVDDVAADHFTHELSSLSPEEFIKMLIKRFSPAAFVCGEDYTFGAKALAGSAELSKLAAEYGIETHIVPTVTLGGTDVKISSTLIRNALQSGDKALAQKLIRGEES